MISIVLYIFLEKKEFVLESDNDSNSISFPKSRRVSSIEETLPLLRALFDKRTLYVLISNRDNGGRDLILLKIKIELK